MLAVALALGSSVVWGTADFLGGVFTRRLALAPVVVVSQLAALAVLAAATALTGAFDERAFLLGMAAGVCGAVGIAAFYRALATGTISIVSPVSACGALVPVVLSLAAGERPGRLALVGSAIALAGAVLASVHEYAGDHPAARSSIVLAATAALGIGGFLFFLGHAARGGHSLPALLGGRSASLPLLVAGALVTGSSMRLPRAEIPARRRDRPARRRRERALRRRRPARLPLDRVRARLGVPGCHRPPRPDHPARAHLAAAEGGHRARARGHRHRQRELTPMQAKDPQNG